MSYAALLVHVDCREDSEARIKCARSLADHFGAAIIGLGAEAIPPIGFDNGFVNYDALWMANMQEAIDQNLKYAEHRFGLACEGFGSQRQWRASQALPADAMAQASRAADLVIADGGRSGGPYQCARADELALICGRPVLVIPPGADHLSARRVMVAWKDTRESRRALSDALPFLREADDVLVVEIGERDTLEATSFRVHDVAAALGRHGVKATAEALEGGAPPEVRLLERAGLMGADLIVAGAYGHSRLGEWIFGGVTKGLLAQDQHFVLLSH